MKKIKFAPNGGPLTAKAVFSRSSIMVANYQIFLRQKNSNAQTTLLAGDNLNPENDETLLPEPTNLNDGRRVILETGFVGTDTGNHPNYGIGLEIWQDGEKLGEHKVTGALTGEGQYSLLFILLEAKQL